MASEILKTYGDVSIKEDVNSFVELLTYLESWFLNNLGKTQAFGPVHQTQTDTLPAVGSLAVVEGEDLTAAAVSTPSLIPNIVQHVARTFHVSDVQRKVAHFNGEDMLAYQTTKAGKQLGNGMEFDIVRSTLTSGQSGTTPKMNGIINAISKSTNTTAHNSGTTLVASIINGLLKANWDNSNGNIATDLFMGSFLRNVVDGFTQKSNTLVTVDASTIHNLVDVIQTSFGRLNIHLHRYVQSTTAGGIGSDAGVGRLLAVRPEYLKIAYLNPIYMIDLAKTGASDKRAFVSDLTMEVKNQDVHINATGFDTD